MSVGQILLELAAALVTYWINSLGTFTSHIRSGAVVFSTEWASAELDESDLPQLNKMPSARRRIAQMSASTYISTVYDTDYKANASSNTMGSLGRGEKVLVIRRRLKTKAVRRNGPPGRFHALAGPVVGEATLYWTAMHRHLIFCGWCPGSRRFAATVNCAM